MPIGIMGSKRLRFKAIQQQGTRKNEYVFVLFPSIYHAETPWGLLKQQKNHHHP